MALEPIIDYFSFSIPVPLLFRQYQTHINEGYPFDAERRIKRLVNFMTSTPDAVESKSSGRFNRMLHSEKLGWTYFDGAKADVSLFQISGTGCNYLRSEGRLDNVLSDWHDRVTRIDIAVDIETSCSVEGFARARSNQRFDNGGHERSASGETWYVGGYDSDRFSRVYRYNPPHPRSSFLRIEYVHRSKQAKHVLKSVLELGVFEVAVRLGNTFGWLHEDYDLPSTMEKQRSAPTLKTFSNTQRWFLKTVIPAAEKMARRGELQFLIDIENRLRAIIDENANLNV